MDHTNIPIIRIDGRYLYKGEERFIVRGIVYQPHAQTDADRSYYRLQDPLSDDVYGRLLRDLHVLKQLRINTLWVYDHHELLGHKQCMDLLAANEIYVVFATINHWNAMHHNISSINHQEYTLNHSSKIIDSVAQFRNTLGVCIGSTIINRVHSERGTDFHRFWQPQALELREMKRYMRYRNNDTGQRILPLCISDGEWSAVNALGFQYFTDPDRPDRPAGGRVDFYCFVHFGYGQPQYGASHQQRTIQEDEIISHIPLDAEHRQESDMEVDSPDGYGWSRQIPLKKFQDATDPVPILISEYGRTSAQPRNFQETRQLYGMAMNSPLLETLSGGFYYEFFNNTTKFGMVTLEEDHAIKAAEDFPSLSFAMRDAVGASTDEIE